MASDKIQKVIVENSEFPTLSTNGEYSVRYRVVSEDRNRVSHWSPIYNIKADYEFITSGELSVEKNAGHVLVIWNPITVKKDGNVLTKINEYDIWFRWHRSDAGDWKYLERVEATSLTILPATTYTINDIEQVLPPNRLDVEVYLAGNPITRYDSPEAFLKVYSKIDTTI